MQRCGLGGRGIDVACVRRAHALYGDGCATTDLYRSGANGARRVSRLLGHGSKPSTPRTGPQ
jgi:hypothetical protein